MQYTYSACLCSQVLLIFTKGEQRLFGCPKQDIVHLFGIMHTKNIQCFGKGKYHMKVAAIQKVFLSLEYPSFPVGSLTFRAMPVAATIISDPFMATISASFHMSP